MAYRPDDQAAPYDPSQGIAQAYQQYLGRTASPDEIAFHARTSPNNFEDVIRNSSEAQAYASRGQQGGGGSLAPAPSQPQLAYGGGADYNSPGGLQQTFWNTLGIQRPGIDTLGAGVLQQRAGDLQKLGIQVVSGDKIRLPDGTIVDVAGNYNEGTGGKSVWQDPRFNAVGGGANDPYTADGQTFNQGGGGGGFGGGGGSSSSSGSFQSGMDATAREYLLRLLGRSEPGPIDVNSDPNLAPQARAYSDARQRAAQGERAKLAERAAFEGQNLGGQGGGAFTAGLGDIYERSGQDIAGQQAGLVGQEVAARRSDLLNALQLANAIGARDQAESIQRSLADLDNQYRYAALGQAQSQFNDQYGLNLAQFQQQQNRDALLTALGGYGGL